MPLTGSFTRYDVYSYSTLYTDSPATGSGRYGLDTDDRARYGSAYTYHGYMKIYDSNSYGDEHWDNEYYLRDGE
jgi:hypothetical protein